MSIQDRTSPPFLETVQRQLHSRNHDKTGFDDLRQTWDEQVAGAARDIPGVRIAAQGETLHVGELSPGCEACKEGTWDCIFTSTSCNLECPFCCSPRDLRKDYRGSAFGETPEQIAGNHARTRITGISFSGGEPLADPEGLFDWVAWFKTRYPEKYFWVYTNGLRADAGKLRYLGELGIDEIRFNMAATGYDHPGVMRNLATAGSLIPNVTVEIPAIPEHAEKLLGCLAPWSAAGVRFLNLHELMFEAGSRSAALPGPRRDFVTPDGHRGSISRDSRALTFEVMRRVQDDELGISVNDCSLQSKLRQLRGRRRSLAPVVQSEHEKFLDEGLLESCCAFRDARDYFLFHPDTLAEVRRKHPGHTIVRLARTAPLSIRDPGKWVRCETI